jgi:hypothetical protein
MPTQQQPREAPSGANKPVHTVRHRSIKATIWKNETAKGPFFSVNVLRSYKDDNGEWKDAHSFGYDDLMNVAALMYEAHAFISAVRAKEKGTQTEPAKRRP